MLDSTKDSQKLDAMKRLVGMMASGKDVSDCPDYPSWVFDSPDHREKFRKFNDIILKAIDPIPKNRFKNAAEMLESMRKINHQDTNAQKETNLKTSIPCIYIGALILIVGFVGYFSRQITNTLEPISPQQPMPKKKTSEALPANPADEETPSNTKPNTQEVKEAIEAAIRLSIKKPTGELTSADIENVRIIDLRSKQLTDLRFLAKLTQLESLMLFDNKITDMGPLKDLKQLTELDISHNQITDVSPLQELKQLKFLNLCDNPNLDKAQIYLLQKELPKCSIYQNAGK